MTKKIIQFQKNKGLTTNRMAMLLNITENSYRNYISRKYFKDFHYERLVTNFKRL